MSIASLLFSTADVQQPVYRIDASGAQVIDGYTTVYAGLPCNIQPLSAGQHQWYWERGIEVDSQIFVDVVQEYGQDWRFVTPAKTYHVKGVRDLIELGRLIEIVAKSYPTPTKKQ